MYYMALRTTDKMLEIHNHSSRSDFDLGESMKRAVEVNGALQVTRERAPANALKVLIALALVALGLSTGGCQVQSEPPHVLSTHQTTEALTPTAEVGDDCSVNGDSICKSHLCLHTGPGRDDSYRCSMPCSHQPGSAPCPVGWTCQPILPGQAVCSPPQANVTEAAR